VAIGWWWLRYKSRHLFWSELAGQRPTVDPVQIAQNSRFVVLLTPSPYESRMLALSMQPGTSTDADAPGTLVTDFDDSFNDEAARQVTLARLEKAIQVENGRAVVVTSIDPSRLTASPTADATAEVPLKLNSAERARWCRVLEPFRVHLMQATQNF